MVVCLQQVEQTKVQVSKKMRLTPNTSQSAHQNPPNLPLLTSNINHHHPIPAPDANMERPGGKLPVIPVPIGDR
jgi:hypothetical protein